MDYFFSSYFLLRPPKRELFCPERREEPEEPKSPGAYFLSPKVGEGVFPNMEPEVLPKLNAGF